jgi:NAD-dependent SIR2 family protein deacetylase
MSVKKLGLDFADMANPKWFAINPSLAWAFYGHRLNLYTDTTPHNGFKMLLELVKTKNNNYFIFTSNVDGQFQKAGFDENKIYEVHGSIHHLQCTKNCNNKIWEAKDEYIEVDMDKFEAINIHLCEDCGAIARPNILMFGDFGWNYKRANKQNAKYNKWLKQNKNKNIAIVEIGAGKDIPTIRSEDNLLSKKYTNTKLIRINPRDFNVDGDDISIALGGLEGLREIL